MDSKKFKQNDEFFYCVNCGYEVNPLGYTSRDHCNNCLYALHVDINPGDRLNNCKGILKPIDYEKCRDTYKIIYRCEKCGEIRKNIMAKDDNFDALINIRK